MVGLLGMLGAETPGDGWTRELALAAWWWIMKRSWGKAYHRATRGPSEPLGSEASSSEVTRSRTLCRCHSRGHEKNP